jgi:eukaryotic-like serine/threonine-protein kinase
MPSITTGVQLGRYVIRGRLGAGGMGEVYLADDTQLGRRVALKVLPPEREQDLLAQRRLVREAQAAATLDHPHICAVYEVGEADGRQYIAMQYVEGETLDSRMRRSPLDLRDMLGIAVQIADALGEAHRHGILHRDIKPANIMITARGDAKVMDFGLAKHAVADGDAAETASALSRLGEIYGTTAYMSPEQARGQPVDARTDLFSMGALLYEMVAGQRPFQGSSAVAIVAAILTSEPAPLAGFAPNAPAELERIISKLLKKSPDNRYQTANDLLIDLRTLKEEQEFQARLERTPLPAAQPPDPQPLERRTPWRIVVPGFAVLLIVTVVGWFAWRTANVRRANARVAEVAALAEAKRDFEAYDLATSIEAYVPGDPTIASVMSRISDSISVETEPSGAAIYLRRFAAGGNGTASARQLLGMSPLSNVRIARGQYVLEVEKEGYAPIEKTVSGVWIRQGTLTIVPPPLHLHERLVPAAAVPARMVFVPGGDYRLISWSRPTDTRVRLDDYLLDKYEVSNREYREFISAGGYVRREFWKHAFLKNGQTISWDEAMRTLVDRSGLPGPRSWSNQAFPDGKGDHPVTDVTWYEAEAYAAFRGKRLPTVFQWEKAARNGFLPAAGVSAMPWGVFYPGDPLTGRANFGSGTWPTTGGAFGMSSFGAYNMAGNVSEWTVNDSSDGFLATGGAWGEPSYTFGQFGGRPGFFSSEKLGFRCTRTAAASAGDQGGMRINLDDAVPEYVPSSPETFAKLARSYDYDRVPLEARVEQTVEAAEWKREKITFIAANGGRAIAYLYLPNHVAPPVQTIHYLPAGDVSGGFRSLPDSIDDRMTPFVRAGRAVFAVVLEGYIERLRPRDFVAPSPESVEFAEAIVQQITDLRRGLDYLETRKDIDMDRLAAIAPSAGSSLVLILGALETRYKTLVYLGAGLPASNRSINAVANPIYFTPHIKPPKLIVSGRYDEDTPVRTATEPLLKLMKEPKRLTLYEGGHVPTVEVLMSATSGWLDEHLGRVGVQEK